MRQECIEVPLLCCEPVSLHVTDHVSTPRKAAPTHGALEAAVFAMHLAIMLAHIVLAGELPAALSAGKAAARYDHPAWGFILQHRKPPWVLSTVDPANPLKQTLVVNANSKIKPKEPGSHQHDLHRGIKRGPDWCNAFRVNGETTQYANELWCWYKCCPISLLRFELFAVCLFLCLGYIRRRHEFSCLCRHHLSPWEHRFTSGGDGDGAQCLHVEWQCLGPLGPTAGMHAHMGLDMVLLWEPLATHGTGILAHALMYLLNMPVQAEQPGKRLRTARTRITPTILQHTNTGVNAGWQDNSGRKGYNADSHRLSCAGG